MRVILSGGGTAGHVYPALALGAQLRTEGAEVLYVGTPDSIEQRLAAEAGIAFEALVVRPLESDYTIWRGPDRARYTTLVTAPLSWILARRPAGRIIDAFRPDVVVGFGGYVCTPIVWAAARRGVPVVLHEQNSVMGKANRQLASRADVVALTFEQTRAEAQAHTRAMVAVVGNPVRPAMFHTTRDEARAALGLRSDEVFILVFGGSRGARALNDALVRIAPEVLRDPHIHIMQATGERDFAQVSRSVDAAGIDRERYIITPYIDEMDRVMPAADLVIARAGSTSIAEIAALSLPAILIPFPHATGDHQTKNARSLVESGAALMIADDQLVDPLLLDTIRALASDEQRRERMREAARSMGSSDALGSLTRLVTALADPAAAPPSPV